MRFKLFFGVLLICFLQAIKAYHVISAESKADSYIDLFSKREEIQNALTSLDEDV